MPAVIAWQIEEAERRCVERAGGDPDLVGPDSPNLERLRAAKADLAEDQRDLGRSKLYDAAEVRMALSRAAAHLRKADERLERRYGPDA